MKLKNIFDLLPFRAPKTFNYKIVNYQVGQHDINYAQWLHPSESEKRITEQDIAFYSQFIKKGDFVIDIGAHTGDTTVLYGLLTGGNGKILAFEPNEYVFKILNKNASLNLESMHIIPYMFAVGDRVGDDIFNYSDYGFCNGGNLSEFKSIKHGPFVKLKVQTVDILKLLENHYRDELANFSFIKIDTEGNDLYVLQHMSPILRKYRPVVMSEIYKLTDLGYRRKLIRLLEDMGYKVKRLDGDEITVDITSENISGEGHFDILALPQ